MVTASIIVLANIGRPNTGGQFVRLPPEPFGIITEKTLPGTPNREKAQAMQSAASSKNSMVEAFKSVGSTNSNL
jgi:hypothetical protein